MSGAIIYDRQPELLAWAAQKIGLVRFRADAVAIGRESGERIVGVVVFDGFSSTDCNVHLASDGSKNWMTREFAVRAMAYPFIQLNYRRITGLVHENDAATLAFDEHFGFKREGLHRCAAEDGGNVVSLGLLRSECRFIPQEFRYV